MAPLAQWPNAIRAWVLVLLSVWMGVCWGASVAPVGPAGSTSPVSPPAEADLRSQGPPSAAVDARVRLIHQHMAAGRFRQAQKLAQDLVAEVPNFQLGHLLLGDAASALAGRFGAAGILAPELRMTPNLGEVEAGLRSEARRRVTGLRDRPPPGHLPSAFLALPESTRHAIAIDSARHRLYLFERNEKGLQLVADHHVSLGRGGLNKATEGDQKTPVGVYFTTSRLEGQKLGELYGIGALTLNYPNDVDRVKGRTGSGIWLHGTPVTQYARLPLSSDGCIVLSNPDMTRVLQMVAPQGTPVVIAHRLDWIEPQAAERSSRGLGEALTRWWADRDGGDEERVASHYAETATRVTEAPRLRRVSSTGRGSVAETPLRYQPPKELSILTWHDQLDHAVVTFGDVGRGQRTGVVRRQYWAHDGQRWRIVHESINPN